MKQWQKVFALNHDCITRPHWIYSISANIRRYPEIKVSDDRNIPVQNDDELSERSIPVSFIRIFRDTQLAKAECLPHQRLMKKYFLTSILVFLVACGNRPLIISQNRTAIPHTSFSLELPKEARIEEIEKGSSNYKDGMRTIVSSHDPESFYDLLRKNEDKKYYSFGIYEAVLWVESPERWIASICGDPALGSSHHISSNTFIINLDDKCSSLVAFGLLQNGKIYKIILMPDNRNSDAILSVLYTATLD